MEGLGSRGGVHVEGLGSRGGVHVEVLALGVGSMWKDWL